MSARVSVHRFQYLLLAGLLVVLTSGLHACSSDDSVATESCQGTPTPCTLMGNACADQDGCVSSACNGTALACLDIPTAPECWEQADCEWREGCNGDPIPCINQTIAGDCNIAPQCTWNTDTDTCTGEPDCTILPYSIECSRQDGCEGGFYCFGDARQCVGLDSATCAQQFGCDVECTGTPSTCSGYIDQANCVQQAGCDWQ